MSPRKDLPENVREYIRAMAESERRERATYVPSPGGWTPPDGTRPGWNWVPPKGAVPRLDRMPRWVRVWYHTPLIDRFAMTWMWHHGGFDVAPYRAAKDRS